MTIEEKARAYDEALERAKKLIDENGLTEGSYPNRETCETIFPELAESEDERIRKAILSFIKNRLDDGNPPAEYLKKWIAWLEKQKEQKPVSNDRQQECEQWNELQADFRNINEAFEDGKKEVVAHPEKYDLCKPVEWSEEDEKMYIRVNKSYIELHGYVKDNPVICESCANHIIKKTEEELHWLKSLRDRFIKEAEQ